MTRKVETHDVLGSLISYFGTMATTRTLAATLIGQLDKLLEKLMVIY